MDREKAYEIFKNADEAYIYAMNSRMSFDAEGYLITVGCEGVSEEDWENIQAAALVIGDAVAKGIKK